MRRVVGVIVVLAVWLIVFILLSYWSSMNEDVLLLTTLIGSSIIGLLFAALVAWFLKPLLDKEEEA